METNRQIKFRVWVPRLSSYLQQCGWEGLGIRYIGVMNSLTGTQLEKSECVFEQFTGLLDKNEQEIYEGDILHLVGTEKRGEVYFSSGAFHVRGVDCLWFGAKHEKCDDYEIIGNIHDIENSKES